MSPAAVVARWEHRLRREGLAPIDQRLRGRVVVRTEIIKPRQLYVPDPERLAVAIEAWLHGDPSHFADHGLALLERAPPQRWNRDGVGERTLRPRKRARILLRACKALEGGSSVRECFRGQHRDMVIAYEYLRPLYMALAEHDARVDDDDRDDDDTASGSR